MKSLQESLFDKDLTKKKICIDYSLLKDELFYLGRSRAKFFDKKFISYGESSQRITIRKLIDDVIYELTFEVTPLSWSDSTFSNDSLTDIKSGFVLPRLCVFDINNNWRYSYSDPHVTQRRMDAIAKKRNIDIPGQYNIIYATDDNMSKILNLYDDMIHIFGSNKFIDELKKYKDRFEEKHAIPGIILDILMKELIK